MKPIIRLILSVSFIGLILSGCGTANTAPRPELISQQKAILEDIAYYHKEGLKNASAINLFSSEYTGVDFGIPWYFGAKINMEKKDYDFLVNQEIPVLMSGYGIRDRINIDFQGYKNNSKVMGLGFVDIRELYVFIFDRVTNSSSNEMHRILSAMQDHGLLNVSEVVDSDALNSYTDGYLNKIFARYIELDSSNTHHLEIWYAGTPSLKTNTTRAEYIPYAFTSMIVEKLLSNSESKLVDLRYIF
ncbi:hypothetical protein ACPF04_06465 [Campylobacter sp. MOP51]|uniref:hypothetical protein n=1 Tax=Campylobacter canis TaxID=3378588 RepID=UPI003C38396C